MTHQVEGCRGYVLWNSPACHVELWCCGTGVAPHRHPGQTVEIVPLWGWGKFYRLPLMGDSPDLQILTIGPRRWFHAFTVPDGWLHWFSLQSRRLLFLSITTGQSPADNFVK